MVSKTLIQNMVILPAGRFLMGSDQHYSDEAPVRLIEVDSFAIDKTPVTIGEFARFIADTGYVTTAELPADPTIYTNVESSQLEPASAVFLPPKKMVPLDRADLWWHLVPGACWRAPEGPESDLSDRFDHPVTHVTHADAATYAEWAGKSLPTEAEWEYACRGGLDSQEFAWGNELAPRGRYLANYWRGRFPLHRWKADGYLRTSPVGDFPPNGYGLLDMIGNVWEWTSDWYSLPTNASTCCAGHSPQGGNESESYDGRFSYKVLKGGSHLCASNYCSRFRPAARLPHSVDTAMSHIGFRCVHRG